MRRTIVSATWTRRDWRIASVSLLLSGLVAIGLADVISARLLGGDERALDSILANARHRAAAYRRVTSTEPPLDQDAASFYRLAFEEVAQLPPDALGRVRDAVDQHLPAVQDAVFQQYCAAVRGAQFSDGLGCTRCDWTTGGSFEEPREMPYFPQTAILGYCLVLAGRLDQDSGHRQAAGDRYVQAAAYAEDLGQGTFPMALAGVATSKAALRGFGQLVASITDEASLPYLTEQLSRLEHSLPSLTPGLSWDCAHVVEALRRIERSYVSRRSTWAGRLSPRQTIGAWRLSRSIRLVNRLDSASDSADLDTLRGLKQQIDVEGAPGRGAVVYALPPIWDQLVQEVDDLRALLSAVQMTIPLQQWRLTHGSYPDTLPTSQGPPGHHLSYRPSPDRQTYQFVSETGVTVLDMHR